MTRIGVIEDDSSISRVLADALRFNGYEVAVASTGAQALALCGPSSDTQVLVIDIGLPDGDGRDLCRALRAAGQKAPVLFLTALDSAGDQMSSFEAGGNDYLTKPFSLAEVLLHVDALRRTGAAPQSSGRGSW